MDTMNSVKRLSLSDRAVSGPVDPRNGTPLRPLGVFRGRSIWPVMGASPDDPSSVEDDPEKSGQNEDPEGTSKTGDGGEGDPRAKIDALTDEKDRHVRRRQEAEKERDELRARLAEIEGKDKTELEKVTARVTELESENGTLRADLHQARIENAFLTDNKYSWHNPRRALDLADLSEVEIDEDGKVLGLSKALDALAKSDAYLLKPKDGKEEDPVSTGDPKSTSKRTAQQTDAEKQALINKYPALRR